MEWTGFTDEDLRRLKKSSSSSDPTEIDQTAGNRTRKTVHRNVRSKRPMTSSHEGPAQSSTEPIKPEQRLVSSTNPSSPQLTSSGTDTADPPLKEISSKNTDTAVVGNNDVKTQLSNTDAKSPVLTGGSEDTNMDLDEQTIMTKELAKLDKFREHQKMMEELNARKKRMLSEAIKQRQQKAKVESAKLNLIKQELDRLDQMVNNDISVIRNKIEDASREFLEAQKRYDRAEREFIEAKTDLHNKSEAKDLLTEHLYTVIHQNEVRKAKKLAELTHKLDLESTEDDLKVDVVQTVPVPLCLVTPMNQLTSHGPMSPSSTAVAAAATHAEQSAESTAVTPDSKIGESAAPKQMNNNAVCETVISLPSQSADTAEVVSTTASDDSTVLSTTADHTAA